MTAKEIVSRPVAAVLVLLLAPVLLAASTALFAEGSRSVLWRSRRIGKEGVPFDLLMFRTMRDDPDQAPTQRLTVVGRLLRNYSVDHLPMLFNVLRGDLSIVGPRPTEPDRVDLTDSQWWRVLSVRPGVISYAILRLGGQYNQTSPQQRLALESEYVEGRSFWFDLRLVGAAIAALVRSRGNVKRSDMPG